MARPFGSTPVAPLLFTLCDALPLGSSAELTAPLSDAVKGFLREQNRKHRVGWFRTRSNRVRHDTEEDALRQLAEVTKAAGVERLCVELTIVGPDDRTLLEMEDGITALWLGDGLQRDAAQSILRIMDSQTNGVPDYSFRVRAIGH